jgi:hypothetical protein
MGSHTKQPSDAHIIVETKQHVLHVSSEIKENHKDIIIKRGQEKKALLNQKTRRKINDDQQLGHTT